MRGLDLIATRGKVRVYGGPVIGAWFSGSDEAKAGIRAVRALQGTFAQVLAAHPDAAKYKPQIDALVAGADKWDAAVVFYTNDDAVELGRHANAIAEQLAREYRAAPVVPSGALAQGAIEKFGDGAGRAGDRIASWLPWIAGGAVAVAVLPVVFPMIAGAVARRAVRR